MDGVRCSRCGATVGPVAPTCPYCNRITPAGEEAKRRAEQETRAQAQRVANARLEFERKITRTSMGSLALSLLGCLVCCLPLGVVAIVLGLRARKMALGGHMPVPTIAVVGVAIGALSCLISTAFWTHAIVKSYENDEEVARDIVARRNALGNWPYEAELQHTTACKLGELYALENNVGAKAASLGSFDCSGKLTVHWNNTATLDSLRYKAQGSLKDYSVCFKRGERWYVSQMTLGACPEPPRKPSSY